MHAQKRHTDELEARGFLLGSLFARGAAMQIHKKTEKRFLEAVALLIAVSAMAMTTGCPNTAHGVKADTKRALDKTGQKLEDTADKIDDKKDEKKKH